MNCDKYLSLTPIEKVKFLGELIHCVQSDDFLFEAAGEIIELAKQKGIFNGVKIVPMPDKGINEI